MENINVEKKEIPLLRAEDIEIRPGTINEKGMSLLLYKNARVDMKILDDVYGPMNWQRTHQVLNNSVYCTVSVYDPEKETWVGKEDAGSTSYKDPKSDSSDAFKRACFNIGIGRELYTAPFIWLKREMYTAEKKEKWYIKDKFTVKDISYNEQREIIGLNIVNQDGKSVFKYKKRGAREKQADVMISIEQIITMHDEMARAGVTLDQILNQCAINSINQMTPHMYDSVMRKLKKTQRKVA